MICRDARRRTVNGEWAAGKANLATATSSQPPVPDAVLCSCLSTRRMCMDLLALAPV
jgi:hypothetical protein